MYGRKMGFLAAMVLTMALFAGCTDDGKVDERKARNWYNEMQGQGSVTNDVLPDATGNYTGGPDWGRNNTEGSNTERNTYGMRTDNGGNADGKNNAGGTLGQDIKNAWDNVKNDVKNMGRG